jgi:glycosyltransferase involved in cell wall biosynthesis
MKLETHIVENPGNTPEKEQQPPLSSTGLRVLLLAFDCHPTLPSLPIIAYKTCRELARYTEATVVTRTYAEKFKVEGAVTDVLNLDHIKQPLDWIGDRLRGGGNLGWTTKTALTYPTYIAFERMVWKKYRAAIRAGDYDLIVRISPMSPTLPSPIAKWSPIPVVIGPINGGLGFPVRNQESIRKEREWFMPLRNAVRHMPYYQSSYKNAAAILTGFHHTVKQLPAGLDEKIINFPEIGFDSSIFYPAETMPNSKQIRFIFVGRLVPNKCTEVAIQAFADSPELQRHHLTIVGDGPERESLEKRINRHGLQHCVKLTGALDQQAIGNLLRTSHAFVFPSIRELGAGVIIEAMACGLPCIAIDFGATADLINEDRGIKVPVADHSSMQTGYQHAMESIARNPDKLPFRRDAVLAYAQDYSWDNKVANLLEVFKWVTGRRPDRPECYPY